VAFVRCLASFILVVAVSGCSLAIDAADPQRPRNEVPKCDTGKGLVAMDGLMATLFGVTSLAAFSDDASGAGLALAAAGGLFVASAVRGNNAANSCRGAYDEYNASIRSIQRQQYVEAQPPRPAVKLKKPKPKPAPPPEQPEVPVEEQQPPADVPPEYAAPRPPAQKPIAKQPPAPKAPADPDAEDWSSFWKELP
jgi:hypothetical protein